MVPFTFTFVFIFCSSRSNQEEKTARVLRTICQKNARRYIAALRCSYFASIYPPGPPQLSIFNTWGKRTYSPLYARHTCATCVGVLWRMICSCCTSCNTCVFLSAA
uniref:Uncharacterized protein n=1 Tax=Trypanosoma vivax (strain Y486) TaxID=1055687 RepID=G0UAD9_TRYVY|nr:hypothetical protein TVY486_1102570 [Trypanosoma vivax Y486]